jgi:glycosyltransferase involved in cell wall biosynthesis
MSGVLVHEWIEPKGGAERVLAALAERFPDAPIVCAWDDTEGAFAPGRTIETYLARTKLRHNKAAAAPALLAAWRRLPVDDAEWLLCSSHMFAHHARIPRSDAPKFVYAHTPARYLWEPDLDPRGSSPVVRLASGPVGALDRRRAQEPVAIAANSRFVADRIERFWGREATVVYPPVDVEYFSGNPEADLSSDDERVLDALPNDFVLGASRLVSYKRVDLALVAGAAADLPVVIAGDGPERARLEAIASDSANPVAFIGKPSNALLRALYSRAILYAMGGVEDFGIMPVEAMAAGTPVLARNVGGTAETVVHGKTGVLFDVGAFSVREAVSVAAGVSSDACRARASMFDGRTFGDRVAHWMADSDPSIGASLNIPALSEEGNQAAA